MFGALRRVLSVAPVAFRRMSVSQTPPSLAVSQQLKAFARNPTEFLNRPESLQQLSQEEAVLVVSKVAETCGRMRVEQLANLITLCGMYNCDDPMAAAKITTHIKSKLDQLTSEDVVELCRAVPDSLHFTELAQILADTSLDRLDELEEPVESLLGLWDCATRKEMSMLKTMQRIVELLEEKSISLESDQLSALVVSCDHLPTPVTSQVLQLLRPHVVRSLSEETEGTALANIIAMYSVSYASSDRQFWAIVLSRLLPKLSTCEPADLAKAAYGIATCQHLEKVEKGSFLARMAPVISTKVQHFDIEAMAMMMEAFVKARCSHKTLFYHVRKSLAKQVQYGDMALDIPRVLFSLARLQQGDKHFLKVCMERMTVCDLDQMPAPNLPLMMYVMADAGLKYRDTPQGLLHGLVRVTMEKWKTIPDDDFKLIVGCLKSLDFHSHEFEEHMVERMSEDAKVTLAIMHKWADRAKNAELMAVRDFVHRNKDHKKVVKAAKKRIRRKEEVNQASTIRQVLKSGAQIVTGDAQSQQDVDDSDYINHFYPSDIEARLWFKDTRKLPKVPIHFNQNELPNDNVEPAMLSRIKYHSNTNSK